MSPIAVVIPCYNHADVLRRTVDAVLAQTAQPSSIVIVDDASTDGSRAVIDELASGRRDVRIRAIHFDVNRGAPAARNRGAAETDEPYLLFLDADAVLVPDALETFLGALEAHPEVDYAYASFYWGLKRFVGRPYDRKALEARNYIHTTSLLRRSAFPGFDEAIKRFQDWDLWLTMAERGAVGVWIPRELFRVAKRGVISRWLPKFMYRIPWKKIGFVPKGIAAYEAAEKIIREKHHLTIT